MVFINAAVALMVFMRLSFACIGEGRPSIPPEYLIRASLLQILYDVRSERMLMEQLQYNLLFSWFVGLDIDDPVWNVSAFAKNRDRLLDASLSQELLQAVLAPARCQDLLSTEHFSVDGTLVESWASMKSFQPVAGNDDGDTGSGGGRNADRDFRGERRTNATHRSTTDPEAKLYKKAPGQAARLAYLGHITIENRNGLVVQSELTEANGTAEREAALTMLERIPGRHRITVATDKGYDARDFVETLRREFNATPHVAQNNRNRRSAIDGRTTRHPGYEASQKVRKRIEEPFGWGKESAFCAAPCSGAPKPWRAGSTSTPWPTTSPAPKALSRLRRGKQPMENRFSLAC